MSDVPAAPVLTMMALGGVLAIVGSAAKSTTLQAAGLAILFFATAAMVVGAFFAFQTDERDPRPQTPRSAVVVRA